MSGISRANESETRQLGISGALGVHAKSVKTAKIDDKRKKNDIDLGKIPSLIKLCIALLSPLVNIVLKVMAIATAQSEQE
jgi:hypothetical protein